MKQLTNVGTLNYQYTGICGKCGARRIDKGIGIEASFDLWLKELVAVFREVKRVLRRDGTVWLNCGDSYAGSWGNQGRKPERGTQRPIHGPMMQNLEADYPAQTQTGAAFRHPGYKPKDLIGQPWRLAFALQEDGWWLRSDIVWAKCLSGGTRVYAKTQRGEMPTTIKDLVRLKPETTQLWNGSEWVTPLGWYSRPRPRDLLEIELRTGERVGSTPNHIWPTERGKIRADELRVGDVLRACLLPEPNEPGRAALDDQEIGWFVGMYLAEGSRGRGGEVMQFASHTQEIERFKRLSVIARAYDGTCRMHKTQGNAATINLCGPTLAGILNTYISGRNAKTKHLTPRAWQRSNEFLRAVLMGYLEGDGHKRGHDFWVVGFTKNDNLAADLRTICARLGISIRLKRTVHQLREQRFPGWRGQIRLSRSGHGNEKIDTQIIAIRKSRARRVWDIVLPTEPHIFSLASGLLTGNSNPMPESVTDRPTRSHEFVFLLTKSAKYFYDADAVRDAANPKSEARYRNTFNKYTGDKTQVGERLHKGDGTPETRLEWSGSRNLRSVWNIATQPSRDAHFARFPEKLVEPCIKAGTSERGCCPKCGAAWGRVVERSPMEVSEGPKGRVTRVQCSGTMTKPPESKTLGWSPRCSCPPHEPVPCMVLDPFGGSGTTGRVAVRLRRNAVLMDLKPDYLKMARKRTTDVQVEAFP